MRRSPEMTTDHDIPRQALARLLQLVENDDRLRGELLRAQREFFGSDDGPRITRAEGSDGGQEAEAAAQRFAEWFLLERTSENLGQVTPLEMYRQLEENDDLDVLVGSQVGLYLVEVGGESGRARDLDGGGKIELEAPGVDLQAGDVIVGRLYRDDEERFQPSGVAAVYRGSVQLAIAFQRDLKKLELGRRLNQAEMEQLIHQGGGMAKADVDEEPLEALEAELQTVLIAGAAPAEPTALAVSHALRVSATPTVVMDPLLDQLAFDTEVDLDRARQLMLRIWNAHQVAQNAGATESETEEVEKPAPKPTPAPKPKATPSFKPKEGEALGEAIARRIEEGLGGGEDVEHLFADVEKLFGEPIDEAESDDVDPAMAGDLVPLIREFVWETDRGSDDQRVLVELARTAADASVPRHDVESLQHEDLCRHAVAIWIGSAPVDRGPRLERFRDLSRAFFEWLVETQEIDLSERLRAARTDLLDSGPRLELAETLLRTVEKLPRPGLYRLVETGPKVFSVVEADDVAQDPHDLPVGVADSISDHVEDGDLLLIPEARGGELLSVLPAGMAGFLMG